MIPSSARFVSWPLGLIVVGVLVLTSGCAPPQRIQQSANPEQSTVKPEELDLVADSEVCDKVFRQLPVVEYTFDEAVD